MEDTETSGISALADRPPGMVTGLRAFASFLIVVIACACSKAKSDPTPPAPPPPPAPSASAAPFVSACGEEAPRGSNYVILDDDERAKLHARSKVGLVAVKYEACGAVQVLPSCNVRGSYMYWRTPGTGTEHYNGGLTLTNVFFGGMRIAESAPRKLLTLEWARIGASVARPEPDAAATLSACTEATHVIVKMSHGAVRLFSPEDKVEVLGGRFALDGCGVANAESTRDGGARGPSPGCAGASRIEIVPKAEATAAFAELAKNEAKRLKELDELPQDKKKAFRDGTPSWADVAPVEVSPITPKPSALPKK